MLHLGIIGAGWFGCHVARKLLAMGNTIRIYERGPDFFCGASGTNQNRLHCGYHYPRSWQTRHEIALTRDRFIAEYPTGVVVNNFFAISNQSWIDLQSYVPIMMAHNLPINVHVASNHGIVGVEADVLLQTEERVINTQAVKAEFSKSLRDYVTFNCEAQPTLKAKDVVLYDNENNGEAFDGVIDCTSGELRRSETVYFEPAVMAEYLGPSNHFALTVMDGPFPCLYPTASPGRWRVSHVAHTARGSFDDADNARDLLGRLDDGQVIEDMTAAMCEYYPDFSQSFMPLGVVKAVRTKLKNNNASRECKTSIDGSGRIFRVFSGKICSVFLVEDLVMKWLKTL